MQTLLSHTTGYVFAPCWRYNSSSGKREAVCTCEVSGCWLFILPDNVLQMQAKQARWFGAGIWLFWWWHMKLRSDSVSNGQWQSTETIWPTLQSLAQSPHQALQLVGLVLCMLACDIESTLIHTRLPLCGWYLTCLAGGQARCSWKCWFVMTWLGTHCLNATLRPCVCGVQPPLCVYLAFSNVLLPEMRLTAMWCLNCCILGARLLKFHY